MHDSNGLLIGLQTGITGLTTSEIRAFNVLELVIDESPTFE